MSLTSNDGVSVEPEMKKLLRAARQRRMGDELAVADLTYEEEEDWLELGLQTLREA